jgi:SAM-dependent methyltransferase
MIRYYAGARAVVFVPIDEDYGYITLEAMLAARPVITATDAGGPLEFVRDGAEGIVAEPEPGALAAAFDRVMEDRAGAERMGQVGLARYRAEGISWRSVVERLTGAAASGGADAESGSDGEADAMAETAGKGAAAPPASGARSAPPAGAEGDLGALRARLAPRLPEAPPFESVDALLAAYALGTHDGTDAATDARIAAYLGTHWTRYLATLALALETAPRRVLDVGVAPPFAFQALLAAALPGVEMAGVWNRDRPWAQRVESRDGRHPGFDMTLRPANAERDPLPAADAAHDLVLAMEIFEHFAVDPLHFLHEAARVLEPGGHLLLTTPNIVSHRGVWKALNGAAPYSFGLFVPAEGAQGRHNREYTPREVAALAEAAGFETVRLTTADVYDDRIEAEAARLLAARGDDFALRGETILYLGRKAGTPGPVPPGLYHGDPGQLAARLALLHHDRAAGVARIRAENTAREPWPAEGEWAASLLLEWADAEGTLRHGEGRVPLSDPVAPGEAAEITLSLGPASAGAAEGTLTVEMFQEGAGRFAAAGRANVLSLPCAESAFLRLAGAGAP